MVRAVPDGGSDIFHFSSYFELTTPGIFSKTAPCSGRRQPAMASSLPMKQISFDLNQITPTTRQPEFRAQMLRAIRWTALVRLLASLDESTLLRFRHWLEKRQRMDQILAAARDLLKIQDLLPKAATTIDGSSIVAASPTRNTDKDRDPETYSSQKIMQRCLGKMSFTLPIQGIARHTSMQVHRCLRLKTEGRPQKNGSNSPNEGETAMHRPSKAAAYCLI